MIAPGEIQSYLQKICHHYEQWWTVDALTETIAVQQATFSFEQMVRTEEKNSQGNLKKVSLPIFTGIQNYIESEHILLVGSPGVGKSTALLRCLVQLAEIEQVNLEPRIPVLISLKRYNSNRFSCPEDPSGILALIKDTLEPDLWLEISAIKKLLFQDKRLILLLDGLNEMSAGEKRTELEEFRRKCDRCKVPLICTTRELGSGDLSIKRKLEIQPLNPTEIDRFLQECLPEQKQKVSKLLNRDNRELSRTPFMLWMLYALFQKQGTEVETLAEAIRQFFRSFNKNYKEDVPVTDERRKNWNSWLKHLAFTMLNTPDPTDPGLVISRERATQILDDRFGKLPDDSSRIEELLKYHVLESVVLFRKG
ncbi:MAG: NACHT domain-containing protein [Stenomitos frigidus ULC029]